MCYLYYSIENTANRNWKEKLLPSYRAPCVCRIDSAGRCIFYGMVWNKYAKLFCRKPWNTHLHLLGIYPRPMARVYTKNTTQKPLQNYRIYSGLKICISSQRELLIYNQKEEDHLYKEGHFSFLYLFPQTTNVIAVTVSQIIMLQLGKLRVIS